MRIEEVWAYFSFDLESLTGRDVLSYLAAASYSPKALRSNPLIARNGPISAARLEKALSRADLEYGIVHLCESTDPLGHEVFVAATVECQELGILCSADVAAARTDGVRVLLDNPGFLCGFARPPYDRASEDVLLPGMTFAAGWRMWLSPRSLEYVPLEKLEALGPRHLDVLQHGVAFVELYDLASTSVEDAVKLHAEAERLLELRNLRSRVDEFLEGDPVELVEDVGNGRVRLTRYLNAEGGPVRRSKATHVWTAVQTRSGRLVAEELTALERE